MSELKIVITANGEGSRMKGISPTPKHLLWYGGKRIIDRIIDNLSGLGDVFVLTHYWTPWHNVIECNPTKTRAETLEYIRDWKNVLIVDCDVIPVLEWESFKDSTPKFIRFFDDLIALESDCIWFFNSDCAKYGGLTADKEWLLASAQERGEGHEHRASGLYFLKDVGETIDRMTDPNSIASGMIGASMMFEKTFIRVGDPEDYVKAVLKK